VKHKTQRSRLTRKLTALRREAWRMMHRPLAEQHRRYASVLRGHYGYFGMLAGSERVPAVDVRPSRAHQPKAGAHRAVETPLSRPTASEASRSNMQDVTLRPASVSEFFQWIVWIDIPTN
jgi:hypothetical protein